MEQADHLIRGLAEVIEEWREANGLTLRDVSVATGIPTTTLHRRITQPSPFNIIEIGALAKMMGTEPVDLMVEAKRRSPASNGTPDVSRESAYSQVTTPEGNQASAERTTRRARRAS